MTLTIRTRFLLLLLCLAAAFVTGIGIWQANESHESTLILRAAEARNRALVEEVVTLHSRSLATLASDYSLWDDMAFFARGDYGAGAKAWAADNVDPALATFDADAIWVYDRRGRLVYHTHGAASRGLIDLPHASFSVPALFARAPLRRFYLPSHLGPMEVRGAAIVRTQDRGRDGERYGYLLAGHVWNRRHLERLGEITGARVAVVPADATRDTLPGVTAADYLEPLPGPDKRPIGHLYVASHTATVDTLERADEEILAGGVLFSLLLLGVSALCLYRWVTLPLRRITQALNARDTAALRGKESFPGEFHELAQLVEAFFVQQRALATENQERKQAEEALTLQQAFLRSVIDTSPNFIFVKDRDGVFRLANRAVAETYGTAAEAMVGRTDADFNPNADETEAFLRADRELLATMRERFIPEEKITDVAGRTRWLQTVKRPIRDPETGECHVLGISTDITARKQAEEERDRFFLLSRDLLCVATLDGRYVRLNPAWEEALGYPAEELLSRPFLEFVHPDDREATRLVMSRLGDGGEILSFENRYRCQDGSYRWLQWNCRPVPGEAFVYAVARDVTFQKRIEEDRADALDAAERSRQEMASILESIQDAFFALDRDWNFTYVNAAGERLHQRRREDYLGRNLWTEFPDVVGTVFQGIYEKAMHERVVAACEAYYAPLDGWFDTRAFPSENGISIYIRDITEAVAAQTALEESERFARSTVDALTARIAILDERGAILAVNRAWRDFAAETCARCAGACEGADYLQTCARTHGTDTAEADAFADGIRRVMRGETETFSLEYSCPSPDGALWFTGRVTRFPGKGPVRIVVAHEDVTERKRLQEQVLRHEKLAALGELVAGVAHEINNPLSIMMGNAELLAMHDDPQVCDDARVIQRMGDRAARIVRSLLTFAHGNSDARRIATMDALVQETLDICSYKLRKADIALEFHRDAGGPCVEVDANGIQQILLNLINNAEHALRERPEKRLRIRTSCQSIHGERWATVAVEDNGCGIPAENLKRIFDPFFTTKDVGEGTGLGLSICHGIAQAHGGMLLVDSAEGAGTTFTLALPPLAS